MAIWPNLVNPPIILCAMEVRYKSQIDFSSSILKSHDTFLQDLFPVRKENFEGNIHLPNPTEGIATAQVSSKQVGYTFMNVEKKQRLIVSNEAITFIIDDKYPGWNSFYQQCVNLYEHFESFLKGNIGRVSLRYINKLTLPQVESIETYFKIGISAQEGVITVPLTSYFIKYGLNYDEDNINANIIQSLAEREEGNFTFIFDIDVAKQVNTEVLKPIFETFLSDLRTIKNEIFFKSLTNQTLNYYETIIDD